MSDDWPEGVPRDDRAEAEAMSEVIAWTPDGQPRQSLPRQLPRPTTVVGSDQILHINGWVILPCREDDWMQWLIESVAEWNKQPCDEASRHQLLGIFDALEGAFRRSTLFQRVNLWRLNPD